MKEITFLAIFSLSAVLFFVGFGDSIKKNYLASEVCDVEDLPDDFFSTEDSVLPDGCKAINVSELFDEKVKEKSEGEVIADAWARFLQNRKLLQVNEGMSTTESKSNNLSNYDINEEIYKKIQSSNSTYNSSYQLGKKGNDWSAMIDEQNINTLKRKVENLERKLDRQIFLNNRELRREKQNQSKDEYKMLEPIKYNNYNDE